ncbi:MAG TPA: glycosyltransferase family 4 protein [Tepidisphaeraceae bacterium]|nr:glycosyltransferase family 4 protein [Tepidisphaeraceae bacterium]
MKIALVTHRVERGDGQGRVNHEIARHCLARGNDITLVADRVDAELVRRGAKWIRVSPRFHKPRLMEVAGFARAANGLLASASATYDLVVANGFTLTRPHHVNLCHFVHHGWRKARGSSGRSAASPRAWYQRAYTRYNVGRERDAFAAARTVVAVSERVKSELVGSGVNGEKIRVIPNGVDLQEFKPGHEPRAELGLPEGRALALFVGDLRTERKNLRSVLHALARVRDLHLAVAGATAGSPFPRLADQLGVAGRVHFLGFRDDVARLMRACDLLVFPSRYEPFGLVVLEALASGLPVVTARAVGASAIVTAACGRVMDDADDVAALESKMRELASDAPLRRRLAEGARAAAESHGWQATAERYLSLFQEHLS